VANGLFLVEALPPVVMAAVTWHLLTDRPTTRPG